MNSIRPAPGVEFVKMGYYCRVCFLFYSNEDTAKKIHCSSQAHYDKLKVTISFHTHHSVTRNALTVKARNVRKITAWGFTYFY